MLTPVTVTVPAAGETQIFNRQGCSMVALVVPSEPTEADAPRIWFDGNRQNKGPVIPYIVMSGNNGKGWSNFTLEGTTESAGGELVLLFSDVVIPQSINVDPSQFFSIEPGATFGRDSTDAPQSLAPADYTDANGRLAKALTMTAQGNDIRIAFGGTSPDQVADPNGVGEVIKAGDFRRIEGIGFISSLEYISAVGAAHASVNFTMEF